MELSRKELLEKIANADKILIGLGEEFDNRKGIDTTDGTFEKGKNCLMDNGFSDMLGLYQKLFVRYRGSSNKNPDRRNPGKRLAVLAEALKEKDYYVVSVSTNREIEKVAWKAGSLVMPCGSYSKMQCSEGCDRHLSLVPEEEIRDAEGKMQEWIQLLSTEPEEKLASKLASMRRKCPLCGKPMTWNTIYNADYDEQGYLPDWQSYTKWIQSTLNRNLLVLELGVGMNYPSVIRFPFEKIVYFNQKAQMIRVNENLYQLTEELAGKGVPIAKNAIDWLSILC